MDNFSRRYYERELGAGLGPNPSFKEHFGYTEPFRRFVQRESFEPQANEIPNETRFSVLPHTKNFARARQNQALFRSSHQDQHWTSAGSGSRRLMQARQALVLPHTKNFARARQNQAHSGAAITISTGLLQAPCSRHTMRITHIWLALHPASCWRVLLAATLSTESDPLPDIEVDR